MKKIYMLVTACLMSLTLTNCDDFLDYSPTAVIDEDKAFSDYIVLSPVAIGHWLL